MIEIMILNTNNNENSVADPSCSNSTTAKEEELENTNTCSCHSQNILRIDRNDKGLHVDIHRGIFSAAATETNWYDKLLSNVRWHRVKYKSNRFQKDCTTPCYTAFYGGRTEYKPYIAIPDWFQPMIDEVTSHLGGNHIQFNAFLLRLYFDGNDEIAWHTDGRTFLGEEPIIASLSLGCKATFQMRRMNDVWPCVNGSNNNNGGTTTCATSNNYFKKGGGGGAAGVDTTTPIQSFTLNDGDLLVMRGSTQKHWHHRVPKEKGRGVRLNINFRYVLPGPDAERGQMTYYKYMVYGDVPIDCNPPSWSYDEIVSRNGGIMNFVQKGVRCRYESKREHLSEQQQQQTSSSLSTQKRDEANNSISTSSSSNSSNDDESDTQRYLASEQSVDEKVFMSLPHDIREELISQWKSFQRQQPPTKNLSTANNTAMSTFPLLPPSISSSKRKENNRHNNIDASSSFGKKTKKISHKGKIDSFFTKKVE